MFFFTDFQSFSHRRWSWLMTSPGADRWWWQRSDRFLLGWRFSVEKWFELLEFPDGSRRLRDVNGCNLEISWMQVAIVRVLLCFFVYRFSIIFTKMMELIDDVIPWLQHISQFWPFPAIWLAIGRDWLIFLLLRSSNKNVAALSNSLLFQASNWWIDFPKPPVDLEPFEEGTCWWRHRCYLIQVASHWPLKKGL